MSYRWRCPHDMPLDNVTYDGKTITCKHHDCGSPRPQRMHPYPLRVEGDEIEVDVGPVKPSRQPA